MDLRGEGFCNGSFGELLQGVLPGRKKFLVNLKTSNASHARVHLSPSAYSTEKEAAFAESYRRFSKSYKVVRNILVDMGRHDDCQLEIDSDIPVGKGCSSSTSDMVASVLALASSLSLALRPDYVSRMLTEIEPNDGLHYPGTAAYHHTTGELIARYDYVPPLQIIGIDFGGTVDTVEFNRTPFVWSEQQMDEYASLLSTAERALQAKDISCLCEVATKSTNLWQPVSPKRRLDDVLHLMRETRALGVSNTHSGTYLGLLYAEHIDVEPLAGQVQAAMPETEVRVFRTVSCAPMPATIDQ